MNDEKFSPDESLLLIRSMIDKARHSISDQSIYFLIWGWAVFLACVGQYVLKVVFKSPYHYHVWWITILCIVITLMIGRRQHNANVKSYITESMSHLWLGLGIGFSVLSVIFIKIGWQHCYPFFMLFYGLGTFISGKLIRFKPLVVGGIINWILAAIAVHFSYEEQMLFTAAALLTSYIIPGHMLRASYRRGLNSNQTIR